MENIAVAKRLTDWWKKGKMIKGWMLTRKNEAFYNVKTRKAQIGD